ncbi:MMPL family transporter [Psychromonas sp. MME2]|uniref:MMPL family transporter n=1 Tax=Psychromonas sp. MME2 TaxID=3231033 RepID=UPI00339C3A0F
MNVLLYSSKLALCWLIIIIGSALLLLQQTLGQNKLPIETNILALLPENEQDTFAQQAFQQVADKLGNQLLFLIASKDKQQALQAAPYFEQQLASLGLFASVSGKINEQEQQAWADLYFPYRAQLLSPTQQLRLSASPNQQTERVIQQIYNPFSGVTGQEIASDPFLLFREYMADKGESINKFTLQQGYLSRQWQDTFYIMVHAQLANSPYNLKTQALLPKLLALETSLQTQFDVQLIHTGTLFYASHGTQSAINEINLIGVGSLIGIVMLLLLLYRSLLPLTLALLSIGCGLLVAFVVTVLVFKKVHLFSLIFGASLIGVSIDYAFHFLTERLLNNKNWHSQRALKGIFNAITLGLVTSLIGYLGLLVAPFPGLQQLSLFSVVGLLAAYLTVICWYPLLARSASTSKAPNLSPLMRYLALWDRPKIRLLTPLGVFAISCIALTQVHFDDDIRQLQTQPEHLKAQERLIKEITAMGQNQHMLLVKADTQQALLMRLEEVQKELQQWQQQGLLKNYQTISQFLPSISTQQYNYHLVVQLYQSQAENLREKLALTAPITTIAPFQPLSFDRYLQSPVSQAVSFLWLDEINGISSSIILINELEDVAQLKNYSQSFSDLTYLNKVDEVSSIFKEYRQHISELLAAAYLLITIFLLLRYPIGKTVLVITPHSLLLAPDWR